MIEFHKVFKKLVNEKSLEDIPVRTIIRVFAAVRTILESEEENVSIFTVSKSTSESTESVYVTGSGNPICERQAERR